MLYLLPSLLQYKPFVKRILLSAKIRYVSFSVFLFFLCFSHIAEAQKMLKTESTYKAGRLTARPHNGVKDESVVKGMQVMELIEGKDALLYVPGSYAPNKPASLAVMLHGAGGDASHGISYLKGYADANNIILFCPASGDYSWDIIADNSFSYDVKALDSALLYIFQNYALDVSRIAIGGFSDGASYSLCLGLTNGDLFTHIIAFSPGFVYTKEMNGKPKVFISHGVRDHVLPIDVCSRKIISLLDRSELTVQYEEFQGEHEIPDNISKHAVGWFLKKR